MTACAVCSSPLGEPGVVTCRKCGHPTSPVAASAPSGPGDPLPRFELLDIKSACCGVDVDVATRVTCSERCHEAYVDALELRFGKTKVVVDAATGRSHLVPTRRIIERGVRQDELTSFPEAPGPA